MSKVIRRGAEEDTYRTLLIKDRSHFRSPKSKSKRLGPRLSFAQSIPVDVLNLRRNEQKSSIYVLLNGTKNFISVSTLSFEASNDSLRYVYFILRS